MKFSANALLARRLECIANLILSEDDKDGADRIRQLKSDVDALSTKFKDANAGIEALRKEFEEKQKAYEKQLKDAYKEFNKQTGYSKLVDQLLEETKAYADTVEKFDEFSDLIVRFSERPAYKPQVEIIFSTFNAAEKAKYDEILSNANKIAVEYKTGIGVLDGKFSDWQQKTKDIFEERGLNLPKASVGRNAGLFSDVIEGLGKFVGTIFGKVAQFFNKLLAKSEKNIDALEAQNKKLDKLMAKVG